MTTPLTQTVEHGHRNTSLLGAFALVLAFAFGVGTSSISAASVGQQLASVDLGLPLLADIDTPLDTAIPVVSSVIAVPAFRQQAPQALCVAQVHAVAPAVFLARAPPV